MHICQFWKIKGISLLDSKVTLITNIHVPSPEPTVVQVNQSNFNWTNTFYTSPKYNSLTWWRVSHCWHASFSMKPIFSWQHKIIFTHQMNHEYNRVWYDASQWNHNMYSTIRCRHFYCHVASEESKLHERCRISFCSSWILIFFLRRHSTLFFFIFNQKCVESCTQ